ncbi:MAG: ATP-dependent helicase [Pirellulales bacterium]
MTETRSIDEVLARLNPQQRRAATFGRDPLLIVAGAGTGKTATLVQRVAWLIEQGVEPGRILLLTFTRRAAAEMLRRVESNLRHTGGKPADADGGRGTLDVRRDGQSAQESPGANAQRSTSDDERWDVPPKSAGQARPLNVQRSTSPTRRPISSRVWGGTFHAIATRLLRRYGKAIGLPPQFTIHDRGDSEDLMNVVRTELELAKNDKRFPKKGTCMAIYSRCVSAREKLPAALAEHFPWCEEWQDELAKLFSAYVDRKEAAGVLDYDDLLLYWHALLADPRAGEAVRALFDCVLVDEYQDTNALQAELLYRLVPDGQGLTVVGDDAQSIYAFRAATVENMFDLPRHYPNTTVLKLEENYRSTPPILNLTNAVIAGARRRYAKDLWSRRSPGERPQLLLCPDEDDQADRLIREVLGHREAGIDLRRQAVLFRASHHSMVLEAELTRRRIPFHKYGGLKFVEAAHVKDLLAFLRLAENPRDVVAGGRILPLLPGVGPGRARGLMKQLVQAGGDFDAWRSWKPPPATAEIWPAMVTLMASLARTKENLPAQVGRVRKFYTPLLEAQYDHAPARLRDLEQLEQMASRYRSRRRMLQELTLDPPSSTQDLAGPPQLDDDFLVLSTIHSAKGLEWDAVYVIHAADGNIPSDLATKTPEQVEEERRLFYVALTRAKNRLYVCCPMRYYYRPNRSDPHGVPQLTRFLPKQVHEHLDTRVSDPLIEQQEAEWPGGRLHSRHVRGQTKHLWS